MKKNRLLAFALALFGLLVSAPAYATCGYSLTSFTNGSTADAAPVNTNFAYILNCPNFTGPVGIGEPNPVTLLDIVGIAGGDQLRISSPQPTGSTQMRFDATGRSWQLGVGNASETTYGYANKFYVFDVVAHVPRFTIDTAGNVGLGTTSPSTSLAIQTTSSDAAINLNAGGGNSPGIYFDGNGQAGSQMGLRTNGNGLNFVAGTPTARTTVAILNNSGKFGIGTTSPAELLEVNGRIKVNTLASASATALCINSSVISSCSSSRRYKESIRDATFGLKEVLEMRPVTFRWKGRYEQDFGLIAEEVAKIDNRFVTYKDGKIEGVKYPQLTAVLVGAVKQLESENDNQAVRLNRLEKQIAILQRQLRIRTAQN